MVNLWPIFHPPYTARSRPLNPHYFNHKPLEIDGIWAPIRSMKREWCGLELWAKNFNFQEQRMKLKGYLRIFIQGYPLSHLVLFILDACIRGPHAWCVPSPSVHATLVSCGMTNSVGLGWAPSPRMVGSVDYMVQCQHSHIYRNTWKSKLTDVTVVANEE